MTTLEQLDGSFIDESLKETFSDIIYGAKIKGKDVKIAFLLEHKSYKDKLVAFQVARYIINIWAKTIGTDKKELPVVLPIVVYHGKDKWNYKVDIRELISEYEELPEYIKERLPVLKYDLINIREHNEEEIKKYEPLTRFVIRTFKHIFEDKDKLIEYILLSIEEIGEDVPLEKLQNLINTTFIYVSALNKDITEEDIIRKINELDGKGEKIMTILEQRELKGMEKGIVEGMEKGIEKGIVEGIVEGKKMIAINLLRKGFPVEQVAEISELEIEEIMRLRKEMLN